MFTKSQERKLEQILTKARGDEDVLAVIPYGSRVSDSKEETTDSDLDVCLVLDPEFENEHEAKEDTALSRKRLDYLSEIDPDKIDIQIFQQLPIYIRKRVLEEGRVNYCRDQEDLYQLAYRTIQEYEDFAPRLREYLKDVKNG
jgi:hypothetical protein